MKLISLTVFSFLFTSLFSQSIEDSIRRIGEKGEKIVIVDSLSFLHKNLSSEFFVDEATNKPYTGLVMIHYSDKYLDTLSLLNGLKNGWQKSYSLTNSSPSLFTIKYYDQHKNFYVSNFLSSNDKLNMYVKVEDECKSGFYEIVNHKNKIKLKKALTTVTGKKVFKHKIETVKEFEDFMLEELGEYCYSICKQAFFFESAQQFGATLGSFKE